MSVTTKLIAAVQGAPTAVIQTLLRDFAATVRPSAQAVGVVETTPDGLTPRARRELRSLVDGRRFTIFQDLGVDSTACSLDGAGIVTACETVLGDIAGGCDLLVLSKFGKLEAERSGLAAAFAAGVEAQIPILTSVAPKFDAQWTAFAAPLFVMLPPEMAAIEAWWRGVSAGPRLSTSAGLAAVQAGGRCGPY